MEVLELVDPARRRWDGTGPRPVRTYVWRPPAERPPLALLSHGHGGHARELGWLAEALVATGFAVAAPEHHGCTANDEVPEGFAFGWERARDLSFVLDHLDDVSMQETVAVGNSGGAYAVAALLGARLDRDVYQGLMAAESELRTELLRRNPDLLSDDLLAAATASYADDRVTAAFLMAPVLGTMLDRRSLSAIDKPVRIRWGEADDIAPPGENALVYLDAIPGATGESLPCGHLEFSGDIDDPRDIRGQVAAEVVAFVRGVAPYPASGRSTWRPPHVKGGEVNRSKQRSGCCRVGEQFVEGGGGPGEPIVGRKIEARRGRR
ncbi:alpha/beta hydrolase family protein [Tenggerimyces flavus]|uniref:Alpha/beta hydrolase family protein n=1 Tax=Tenggerimyces flavus TaxID=1708749 RepID=A0ABV7YFN5_9ACTN|nr:hypothetical protein [Tenggerimyces flavus]MBM7786068.1 putative dienelactone hydrolase [Tenggerimyces flavus]